LNCQEGKKKDKDNIIAMASEIFQPLQNRGLKVLFNVILSYDYLIYLGESRNEAPFLHSKYERFSGDWVSAIIPHVDFIVVDTEQQWGIWSPEFNFDNDLSASVGFKSWSCLLLICWNSLEKQAWKISLLH
jgi:hypothetical protein